MAVARRVNLYYNYTVRSGTSHCTGAMVSHSATDLRQDLHWLPLPVSQRVIYKLSVLTYNAFHTGQPYM